MNQNHFVLVEQPAMSAEQHAYWARSTLSRVPLMQGKELGHLTSDGPWLVKLEGNVPAEIARLNADLGAHSIIGHVSSYLPAHELGGHLSRALVALMPDESTVLLRSYTPRVLAALYPRKDCTWHPWFFGPINDWWSGSDKSQQHFQGGALKALPDYQPIVLDQQLLDALAIDPQAIALLDEINRSVPTVLSSKCPGMRLEQIELALGKARKSGLTHPEDQLLFATLTLLDGTSPDTSQSWPKVLDLVRTQQLPLSEALESMLEEIAL